MRYYRVSEKFGKTHLCVEAGDGLLTSLSSINERVGEFRDLLDASDITGNSVDAIARHLLKQGRGKEFELAQLIDWSISETGDARIIKPLEPDEMWAGGLGNMIMTPENLADAPEGVRLAYNTPEITTNFYKGTSHRLAGPFDRVGIRADTEHTIAEGELVLVIYKESWPGSAPATKSPAGWVPGRQIGWCPPKCSRAVPRWVPALPPQRAYRTQCRWRSSWSSTAMGRRLREARCRRGSNGRPKRSSPPPLPTTRPPIWSFSTPEDSLRYPTSHSRREMSCGSPWRESDSSRTLSRSSNGCVPVPTQHSATSSGFWKLSLDLDARVVRLPRAANESLGPPLLR